MDLDWKRESISRDEAALILDDVVERIDFVAKMLVDRPGWWFHNFIDSVGSQSSTLAHVLREKC